MFFILIIFVFAKSILANPMVQAIANQEMIVHGKAAYDKRCAGCHGVNGNGAGEAAIFLDPKPRDFTSGIYKFRSSPLGTLPSDQDLMQTLSKGVYGTSMPSFAEVPEQERFAITQYLKTFSKNWDAKESFGIAVQGSPFPIEDFQSYKKFITRVEKGRKLYIESCLACHGKSGFGDGAGSADLTDEWSGPIKPANLTNLYIKTGKSVKDIYKTLLVGVNGTPMASYKDVYTDDQLWDLSAWVLYLRGLYNGVYDLTNPHIPLIKPEEAQ